MMLFNAVPMDRQARGEESGGLCGGPVQFNNFFHL